MGAFVFLREMEQPVVIEVATGAQRPEPQDRFCARKGPARPRASHAVLDKVAARALDDAGCDREPVSECAIVVQERGVPDEVLGGALDGARRLCIQGVGLDHLVGCRRGQGRSVP